MDKPIPVLYGKKMNAVAAQHAMRYARNLLLQWLKITRDLTILRLMRNCASGVSSALKSVQSRKVEADRHI